MGGLLSEEVAAAQIDIITYSNMCQQHYFAHPSETRPAPEQTKTFITFLGPVNLAILIIVLPRRSI